MTPSPVHLRQFPDVPAEWATTKLLGDKWEKIRDVRQVVNGALEIVRREKLIGSSLEAAPKVYVTDPDLRAALDGVDLAEVSSPRSSMSRASRRPPAPSNCLRSRVSASFSPRPKNGDGSALRSRRYFADAEMDTEFPELSQRDAQAMRERAAAGLGA